MILLSRAIEGFLLHKRAAGRSPNTLRNYRIQLDRMCAWLGDPTIDQVTSRSLKEFFAFLQEEYRFQCIGRLRIDPKPLSSKTCKNAWGASSVFWRWASNEFDIENPFNVAPIRSHSRPIQPLCQEEVRRLLRICQATEAGARRPTAKRDQAIILTFLDTGIRVSELTGANISDLDLEAGRLLVTGKGGKSRYVYLGQLSRKVVWRYLAERFPSMEPPKNEPLFAHVDDIHRLTRHGVRSLLRALGRKAGIENLHPHRFRHTFAIEFLRNGGDIFTLQQLLGHSSLDMVRRYVALAEMDMEGAHRRASPADNWRLR